MAYSMERVRGDHGQNLRGGGVGHDEMKKITQRVTLMGQAWPAPRMTEQTNERTIEWTGLFPQDCLIDSNLIKAPKCTDCNDIH